MTASDPPTHVLVVWTTDLNSTRQMAEAVVAGARSVAGVLCEDVCLAVGDEVGPDDVAGHDALIGGTPVRHRSMHHRVKRFVETRAGGLVARRPHRGHGGRRLQRRWGPRRRGRGRGRGRRDVPARHPRRHGRERNDPGAAAQVHAGRRPRRAPLGPGGADGRAQDGAAVARRGHDARRPSPRRQRRARGPCAQARASGLFADGNVSPPPELAQAFADAPAAATPPGPGDNPAIGKPRPRASCQPENAPTDGPLSSALERTRR